MLPVLIVFNPQPLQWRNKNFFTSVTFIIIDKTETWPKSFFLLSTKSQWHFFIQESILHSSCSWTETYAEAFVAMPLSSVGNKNCGMAQEHRNGKFAFLSLKPLQNQSCSINFCSFLWQRQWLRTFRTTLSLSYNLSRRIDSSFSHDFSEKHFQWNRNALLHLWLFNEITMTLLTPWNWNSTQTYRTRNRFVMMVASGQIWLGWS